MMYVLGNLRIDQDGFEIVRNDGVVTVEPRVLEFILYLLNHRTRLVPKSELLRGLWRETFVVESVLSRCACLARRALGNPSLIKTVYDRGYRWRAAALPEALGGAIIGSSFRRATTSIISRIDGPDVSWTSFRQ